jgi:hypothetical protein
MAGELSASASAIKIELQIDAPIYTDTSSEKEGARLSDSAPLCVTLMQMCSQDLLVLDVFLIYARSNEGWQTKFSASPFLFKPPPPPPTPSFANRCVRPRRAKVLHYYAVLPLADAPVIIESDMCFCTLARSPAVLNLFIFRAEKATASAYYAPSY